MWILGPIETKHGLRSALRGLQGHMRQMRSSAYAHWPQLMFLFLFSWKTKLFVRSSRSVYLTFCQVLLASAPTPLLECRTHRWDNYQRRCNRGQTFSYRRGKGHREGMGTCPSFTLFPSNHRLFYQTICVPCLFPSHIFHTGTTVWTELGAILCKILIGGVVAFSIIA